MNYLSYFSNDDAVRKAISASLLKIREENKLTQQKLAELLEVSIEHISRIENCKYTCSITLIFKLCTMFKLSIDEFLGVSEESSHDINSYLKSLPLEKRCAIIDFCKEVESADHHL